MTKGKKSAAGPKDELLEAQTRLHNLPYRTTIPERPKSKKPSPPPVKSRATPEKEAIPDIPEELETVWDNDIAAAFKALRPQQQDFLLCYLREGNAAAAYRKAYNPLAKDHLASVLGSQAMASNGIQSILAKFAANKTEVLFLVMKGYREMAGASKPNMVQDDEGQWMNAGDLPDWTARDKALIGLRKVHSLDAPAEVKHSGKVEQEHTGQINVVLDITPITDLLNGPEPK